MLHLASKLIFYFSLYLRVKFGYVYAFNDSLDGSRQYSPSDHDNYLGNDNQQCLDHTILHYECGFRSCQFVFCGKKFPSDQACACDKYCEKFNDCCFDAHKYCNKESDSFDYERYFEIYKDRYTCEKISDYSYWMVTKCSNGDECSLDAKRLLDEIPVLGNEMDILPYRNDKCAFCNSVFNITPFNFEAFVEYDNEAEPRPNYTLDDIKYLYSSKLAKVNLVIEAKGDVKQCIKDLIDTCPSNCPNLAWYILCRSYHSVVQFNDSGIIRYYKNKYCYFCNNGEDSHYGCLSGFSITDKFLKTYRYNFLFEEIKRENDNRENSDSSETCPENYAYISADKACRKIIKKHALYDLLKPNICSFTITFQLNLTKLESISKENLQNQFDILIQDTFLEISTLLNDLKITLKPVKSTENCYDIADNFYTNGNNTTNCTSYLIIPRYLECNNSILINISETINSSTTSLSNIREVKNKLQKYTITLGMMCENYIEFIGDKPKYLSKSFNQFTKDNTTYFCREELTFPSMTVEENDDSKIDIVGLFGLVCNSLSLVSLLVRLIVPCFLPKLRTKGMWIQWNLALAIFIWQTSILLSPLLTSWIWVCRSIAVLGHLSMISSMSWQSILAIDMFFKFREKSMIDLSKFSDLQVWKFFLLAWGLACLPVIVSITLAITKPEDAIYGIDQNKSEYKDRCWIYGFFGQVILLILPIVILLLINTGMLVTTIRNLHIMLKNSPANSKTSMKSQVIIFTKLSIFFGISWFAMFISAYVDHDAITIVNILANVCIGIWLSMTALVSRDVWKRKMSASETYLSDRQSKRPRSQS
ncbi:DgyrCDS7953 [Dimorphilus gyrociliatus]|uniref:DgyrCDS7953 n=1 Tax=Dimorphilus gyrociliatus TaxID=2664684 RepID=A0A7I8VSR3_9ANNE|nr:DgyrCDS7953 [Dimorphilus gyrociliatus]